MSGLDSYNSDEEQDTTTGSNASVSYVEISEDEHPTAYDYIKGGGPIRSFFRGKVASVDDFFADFVEALGPYFEEGDKVPLLLWIGPDDEDIEAYKDARDEDE
jgi:hypothetical protein